jgi:hypothetical protein
VREASGRRAERSALGQVVLGDGTPWIWNLAELLFPKALQNVDRFHVKAKATHSARASLFVRGALTVVAGLPLAGHSHGCPCRVKAFTGAG